MDDFEFLKEICKFSRRIGEKKSSDCRKAAKYIRYLQLRLQAAEEACLTFYIGRDRIEEALDNWRKVKEEER